MRAGRQRDHHEWYRLDNVAKIYPVVKSHLASNVFKITATMDREVDPSILKVAVLDCRDRFPFFYVKMRKGFFWYYYEPNEREPLVLPESSYVCNPIDIFKNNWYFFTFFYYGNRISLEIFHSLTDGMGALQFLKTVIFRYLELSGNPQSTDGIVLDPSDEPSVEEMEDSYLKNYTRKKEAKSKIQKSYKMTGTLFPQGGAGVHICKVSTEKLLRVSREYGATVGQYIAAKYIYSIMLTGNASKLEKKPINISVPIDMRKYYGSATLRNFFLVFRLSVLKKKNKKVSFEDILKITKEKFKAELTPERLQAVLNSNVSLEKNIAARFIPLPLKYLFIKMANFFNSSGLTTSNLSNLGKLELPDTMSKHVKDIDITFVLGRRSTHNLALISYNGQTNISLTRRVIEDDVDKAFFDALEKDKIECDISGNQWERYIKDTEMEDKKESEFPPYERQKRKDRRLIKALSVLSGVSIVFFILSNIFIWKDNFWSAIASSIVLYILILGILTLKKTLHVGLKLMLHAISLSALLLIINAFAYTAESIHRITWGISYGIPGVLTVFIAAINITMFSHRQNRKNFMLYQLSLSVMGMIPLILVLAGIAQPMWPSITVASLSYITIAGLIIFANKIILSEIKKKFHV